MGKEGKVARGSVIDRVTMAVEEGVLWFVEGITQIRAAEPQVILVKQ